jgi:hypothetical protein
MMTVITTIEVSFNQPYGETSGRLPWRPVGASSSLTIQIPFSILTQTVRPPPLTDRIDTVGTTILVSVR